MTGCNHVPNSAQNFCGRYGERKPEPGVKIVVVLSHAWQWVATCSTCSDFHPMSAMQDDVLQSVIEHRKIDHPRDLVAFSID